MNFSIDSPTFSDPWVQSAYDGFQARVTWFTPDNDGFAQVIYTDTLGPQINADKNTTMYELSKWEKHKSEEIMNWENFKLIEKLIIENNNFTFYILKTSAYSPNTSSTNFSYDAHAVNLQKGNSWLISVSSWNDSNFYKSGESEELIERMLHSFSPGPPGSAPIYPSDGISHGDVTQPTPAPPIQPTQSEDWTGPIVGIIIALIVVGIIAVVAKNRKSKSVKGNIRKKPKIKSKIKKPKTKPSPSPTDQSIIFHYACPNCSAKLQPPTPPSVGQNCSSCGWHS